MNLRELLDVLTPAEKVAFAERVGTSYVYLFQMAGSGVAKRRPSPKLARRLVQVEPRLTLAELRPDIWGKAA